ncbi:hypothetical protein BJ138DRAFT_1120450 [Hygrophoropsis aurantiaca]|uniref:Uncharacterized protein n=1 Tax=Hygrophoropsis aurantiaca TaxID=72124 RepID=A0ACB7ZQH3_9AGAM|nr:hypothetical protein BJ138DRAFT_1120450 [Hygrophoropsis aurantiaca]
MSGRGVSGTKRVQSKARRKPTENPRKIPRPKKNSHQNPSGNDDASQIGVPSEQPAFPAGMDTPPFPYNMQREYVRLNRDIAGSQVQGWGYSGGTSTQALQQAPEYHRQQGQEFQVGGPSAQAQQTPAFPYQQAQGWGPGDPSADHSYPGLNPSLVEPSLLRPHISSFRNTNVLTGSEAVRTQSMPYPFSKVRLVPAIVPLRAGERMRGELQYLDAVIRPVTTRRNPPDTAFPARSRTVVRLPPTPQAPPSIIPAPSSAHPSSTDEPPSGAVPSSAHPPSTDEPPSDTVPNAAPPIIASKVHTAEITKLAKERVKRRLLITGCLLSKEEITPIAQDVVLEAATTILCERQAAEQWCAHHSEFASKLHIEATNIRNVFRESCRSMIRWAYPMPGSIHEDRLEQAALIPVADLLQNDQFLHSFYEVSPGQTGYHALEHPALFELLVEVLYYRWLYKFVEFDGEGLNAVFALAGATLCHALMQHSTLYVNIDFSSAGFQSIFNRIINYINSVILPDPVRRARFTALKERLISKGLGLTA